MNSSRPSSLRSSAFRGVTWIGASAVVATVIGFLQLGVLARILGPEAFGLMAMVMVIVGFARLFSKMGLGAAVIHRQDTTNDQLSSLYWFSILVGVLLFVIVWMTQPVVVRIYGEPRLAGLFPWVALSFLITPVGGMFGVMLRKELRFSSLSIITIISSASGASVAIISAISGEGVFSLIWGSLAGLSISTLGMIILGSRIWHPSIHFSRNDLKGYLTFGLLSTGGMTANYINTRLAQLILGIMLGAQSLGYYNFAFNLVLQPVNRINPILNNVAFPLYSKIQKDVERLKIGYLSSLRVLSIITAPVLFGLAAVAPRLVPTIFGDQWIPAIPIVQLLAIVGLLRSFGNPVGSLLLARGRPDLSLKWNVMLMFTQIPGVLAGSYLGGVTGAALAVAILQIVYFVAGYFVLIRTLLGDCLREYLTSMALPTGIATAMAFVLGASSLFFGENQDVLTLIGLIILGSILYVGMAVLLMKSTVTEFARLAFPRA